MPPPVHQCIRPKKISCLFPVTLPNKFLFKKKTSLKFFPPSQLSINAKHPYNSHLRPKKITNLPTLFFFGPLQETNNLFFRPYRLVNLSLKWTHLHISPSSTSYLFLGAIKWPLCDETGKKKDENKIL